MALQILNSTRGSVVATDVEKADSFSARMKGLLNRESLSDGEALIITRCQSIHMLFMKFPIDVIFVNRENNVVGLVPDIKPFCLSLIFWNASYAVELNVGTIEKSGTRVGDRLEIRKI